MILKRLLVLLAVWAVAAFALYDAYEYEVRISTLKESGVVTVGKISEVRVTGEGEDRQTDLSVSFDADSAGTYNFVTTIEGRARYTKGEVIGVIYSENDPSNAIVNSSSIVTGHAYFSILIGLVFGFLGLWLFGVTIFQISKMRLLVR